MTITPESVGALLNSSNLGDRLKAVNQIRTLEASDAFDFIQQAIHDTNPRIRYAAVSQLASRGNDDRERTLKLLRGRLGDSEPDVQAAAADSLGALQMTEAFPELENLYNTTSEWLVQFSIIAALGELGDPRGFDLLTKALESPNDLTQMVAIGSLGELGDLRAVPLLVNQVEHPDWQVRHRLAQALGRLGTPEAIAALETLAHDEIAQVAQEAKVFLA
jgi:HEAT repeat protein